MYVKNLYRKIYDIKTNNSLISDMVKIFNPLLKRYARILKYEDAYEDLQLAFIEIILKINLEKFINNSDGAIVNYINRSIVNCFYDLYNKNKKYQWYHVLLKEKDDTNSENISYEYFIHNDYISDIDKNILSWFCQVKSTAFGHEKVQHCSAPKFYKI